MDEFVMAGLDAFGHFVMCINEKNCLACGFFARSKTKVRGIAANFGKKRFMFNFQYFSTESDQGWSSIFSPQNMGRDKFTYCLCINKDIGKKYLVTTDKSCNQDWYNYLMEHYKLPLKQEWIPLIRDVMISKQYVTNPPVSMPNKRKKCFVLSLKGIKIDIADIRVYSFEGLNEETLEKVISEMLASKQICITPAEIPPLEINGLDDYFKRYGYKAVENLDKKIKPLIELRPNVRNLALKQKSLFPQQAASVEGILAMKRHGIKYAVLNHGMGCGKTIEAAAAIDAIMVEKWLKLHPGKTLKDAYAQEGIIKYRVIVMAPGHLVAKWAQEVEAEIPYSKAVIINKLSQLTELREAGRKPNGKMFYIISMDYCKLDTQLSPTPTRVKAKHISLDICSDCLKDSQKIVYKKGIGNTAKCPDCQGSTFEPYELSWQGMFKGLVCPKCGELLIKYKRYNPDSDDFIENIADNVLTPAAFAHIKGENAFCYHCGEPLWGSNARPLITGSAIPKEPKWYKITHYKNHTHKSTCTSFVLKGYEEDYYRTCITTEGMTKSGSVYGPRKVAPARYIKQYLKDYFDFCVLDECHKYLGESAQGTAAHALVKASRFTLALTGTISNGTASCFYNLFWMLEPKRMLQMGYTYSNGDMMRFCKEYGCVETVYEASTCQTNRTKNIMSRGKQLYEPRIKPGISPVLLGKFLLDRCLFMDISDLSKYLPRIREEVKIVPLPEEIRVEYNNVIATLQEASRGHTGMAALSAMLQFGLSYPDKPYDREPIKDPFIKDALLCKIKNFDQYANPDRLLPKEKTLIDIVNAEITQGRGVFVYATFTGKEETNVSYRLKDLIERYCNLKDRVAIIQSNSPAAGKREEWFHKKASEGIKVFITNPKNVETGLDFCFKYDGVSYNYPTLIFYQISYMLATIWQASRRGYRLTQKEECRNYYLAYEDTLQTTALEIMAKKQVSTAAIQGHFSAEGLASMARGVDARTLLAEALSRNDMSSRESLENMFDALRDINSNEEENAAYASFKPSLTFWELIGKKDKNTDEATDTIFSTDICDETDQDAFTEDFIADDVPEIEVTTGIEDDFLSFFNGFTGFYENRQSTKNKSVIPKKKAQISGQQTVFDLILGSI